MAHSGQNSEMPEVRGIWVSTQPLQLVSGSVPAMCNMALMTPNIDMQDHREESSDQEEFGYPSDTEWWDMICNIRDPVLIAESRALVSEDINYAMD